MFDNCSCSASKEPLPKTLTTFKIGGPARFFADITDRSDLPEGIRNSRKCGRCPSRLGGGSNMLVSDRGFEGLVVQVSNRGIEVGFGVWVWGMKNKKPNPKPQTQTPITHCLRRSLGRCRKISPSSTSFGVSKIFRAFRGGRARWPCRMSARMDRRLRMCLVKHRSL